MNEYFDPNLSNPEEFMPILKNFQAGISDVIFIGIFTQFGKLIIGFGSLTQEFRELGIQIALSEFANQNFVNALNTGNIKRKIIMGEQKTIFFRNINQERILGVVTEGIPKIGLISLDVERTIKEIVKISYTPLEHFDKSKIIDKIKKWLNSHF